MKIGYACINSTLQTAGGVTTNRGMRQKTYNEKGLDYVSELALQNCRDLVTIVKWNEEMGIKLFRMSSDLFPWMTLYDFTDLPDYNKIANLLKGVGVLAEKYNQRLTFHPSHFNALGSPNPVVVEKAIKELDKHSDIMDLIGLSTTHYNKINIQFEEFSSKLYAKDIRFIPISALDGDNVVNRSKHMDWYQGAPLLNTLENLHISSDINKTDARFPVQTVLRPQRDGFIDYRGYAGRVASGIFRPGDKVTVMPSGFTATIKSIDTYEGSLKEAYAPMSVSITLENDIDVSRGDMIVKTTNQPKAVQEFDTMLCWLNNNSASPKAKYTILHTSNEQKAMIKDVMYKIDINTYCREEEDKNLNMNDIARVKIRTTRPLMVDEYRDNRVTGSFVLIDDTTYETVAAGMIL